MADAFFAKKKKKKAFKGFNANKIDVSTVTQTVHVDAPAISEETKAITERSNNSTADESQWDEEAAATNNNSTAVVVNEREILDVKTLSENREELSDNIKERLKLEETKAALQKARDGMQQEAQRLKQQQQQQQEESKAAAASSASTPTGSGRFSAAAQNVGSSGSSMSGGGKWVPPHMRGGGASLAASSARRSGGVSSFQKLDTKDETLFPDLNTADKILEQEKKQEQAAAYKPVKKTPISGATWGGSAVKKPATASLKQEPKEEAPVVQKEEVQAPTVAAPSVSAKPTATTPAEPPKTMPVKKKKKKKDLSTFKPGSS